MITNTCVLSYTEVLQKKAEELYNKHRDSTATIDRAWPKWCELPQYTRIEWMRVAKCREEPRQNKLMP